MLRAYYLSAQEFSVSCVNSPDPNDAKSRDPRLRAKEARLRVEEALGACLLPSLQLVPANPAVGQEIWDVLSMLPYEVRLISLFLFCILWYFIACSVNLVL